jgi:hypothetical protein
VVLTDSHGISRAPCYLGSSPGGTQHYGYGANTLSGRPFKTVHLCPCSHPTGPAEPVRKVPQPRPCNARRLSHMERFSLIRVRSPLLTESLLFSLPAGTEMFHFPAFPPRTLCVQMRVTRSRKTRLAGFPHSDILGSPFGYQLPQAYRRFLRPSSAPNAKASTVCP